MTKHKGGRRTTVELTPEHGRLLKKLTARWDHSSKMPNRPALAQTSLVLIALDLLGMAENQVDFDATVSFHELRSAFRRLRILPPE